MNTPASASSTAGTYSARADPSNSAAWLAMTYVSPSVI